MRVRVRGAADLAEGDGRADDLLRAVLQQTAHGLQQLHRGRQHRLARAVRVHLVRARLGLGFRSGLGLGLGLGLGPG